MASKRSLTTMLEANRKEVSRLYESNRRLAKELAISKRLGAARIRENYDLRKRVAELEVDLLRAKAAAFDHIAGPQP